MIFVRPGTSVNPIQKDSLLRLIESGVVSSGDAIYIEKRESAIHVRCIWGVVQIGSGLTTIFIKPTSGSTEKLAVQLKDIEHFILFNVAAFSCPVKYDKLRGLQ